MTRRHNGPYHAPAEISAAEWIREEVLRGGEAEYALTAMTIGRIEKQACNICKAEVDHIILAREYFGPKAPTEASAGSSARCVIRWACKSCSSRARSNPQRVNVQ